VAQYGYNQSERIFEKIRLLFLTRSLQIHLKLLGVTHAVRGSVIL